jgi:TfoX/Sxy family transcriptional regulator of competence genes
MAYDEHLANRIKAVFDQNHTSYEEKKMMGGLCFMVDDKMCVGVIKNELMARVDPEIYEKALSTKGSREMDFTGRAMRGFLFIAPQAIDMEKDLEYWLNLCLEFNPKAKSSKKK